MGLPRIEHNISIVRWIAELSKTIALSTTASIPLRLLTLVAMPSKARRTAGGGGGTKQSKGGKSGAKDLTKRIESVLTRLAKECLSEEPDDVERFCYEVLGNHLGHRISSRLPSVPLTHGVPSEDEESLAADACKAQIDKEEGRPGKSERVAKYKSTDSGEVSDEPCDEAVKVTRIKSMAPVEGATDSQEEGGMFSMIGMTEAKLAAEVEKYRQDQRMTRLYKVWDGDNSGAIDLAELVVELHKFDEVARESAAIQVASEALVRCDNSDNGELDMRDFTKLIVLFCHNIFKLDFDSVAEHLLAVAESTSEEAARAAADGHDVSEIMQMDEEEREFLKETVKGIQYSINENVRKLKGKK